MRYARRNLATGLFTFLSRASSRFRILGGGEFHMSDVALPGSIKPAPRKGPNLDGGFHPLAGIIYMGVIAAALLFVAFSIYVDVDATGTKVTTYLPYILLFVALLIALLPSCLTGDRLCGGRARCNAVTR
jgi:hypothetical protein